MSRKFIIAIAMVGVAGGLAGCGGGGGGGGGPVLEQPAPPPASPPPPPTSPPPPPPPPPPPECLDCGTGKTTYYGASGSLYASGPSSVGAGITNIVPGVSVTVDRSGPTDVFTVSFDANGRAYTQTFADLRVSVDPVGAFAIASGTKDGLRANFFVFDVSSALSGSLDYVQLAGFDRETGGGAAELAVIAFGRQTAAGDMPTSGTARYVGGTRGAYYSAEGKLYSTGSDITMTADFGTGAINGETSNFRAMTSVGGESVTLTENLNFGFTASIASGASTFSGTAASVAGGLGLSGRVEGAFFGGPGRGPEEAGLSYQLGSSSSGPLLSGGAAMGRQQ